MSGMFNRNHRGDLHPLQRLLGLTLALLLVALPRAASAAGNALISISVKEADQVQL